VTDTPQSSKLVIGVVSEIHCTPPGEPNVSWHNELRFDLGLDLLETVLTRMERFNVDIIAVLGDLSHFADVESLARVRRLLRATGKPVITLSGNHDITAEPGSPATFQQYFADRITCAPPMVTTLNGFAVQLLGLERDEDSNLLNSLGPPFEPRTATTSLIMSHYPLLPLAEILEQQGLKHAGDLTDLADRTRQLSALTQPTIVFHGHLHVRATTVAGSVLHLSFAALVEPPHEYSIVTITGNQDGFLQIERAASSVYAFDAPRSPVLSSGREQWRFASMQWNNVGPA